MSRDIGQRYEALAERLLVGLGYQIIERNFTCRGGELDLVCRDGEVLVFVEVRGRRNQGCGAPEETVSWRKQRRVLHAAAVYLSARQHELRGPREPACRFDVIGIDGSGARLYRDAFSETSA